MRVTGGRNIATVAAAELRELLQLVRLRQRTPHQLVCIDDGR